MRFVRQSPWELKLAAWLRTVSGRRLIFLLALGMSVFLGSISYPGMLLRMNGIRTEGWISDLSDARGKSRNIKFEYYVDSTKLVGSQYISSRLWRDLEVNQRINVWYDPDDPAEVTSDVKGDFSFLTSLIVPPILVLVAATNLVAPFSRGRTATSKTRSRSKKRRKRSRRP